MSSGCSSQRRVDPSMSVNKRLTVPVGSVIFIVCPSRAIGDERLGLHWLRTQMALLRHSSRTDLDRLGIRRILFGHWVSRDIAFNKGICDGRDSVGYRPSVSGISGGAGPEGYPSPLGTKRLLSSIG